MLKILKRVKYTDYNTAKNYGKNDLTQTVEGVLPVNDVKELPPSGHERRTWETRNNVEYFGMYRKEDWETFLDDIKVNGVKEAIMIYVEKDGTVLLGEGNHRIEACLQTGVTHIPVDIRYFGGSETHVDVFDKHITK